jgi:hypothetical protein
MQQAHTAPPRPTTCQHQLTSAAEGSGGPCGGIIGLPVFQGPEQPRALPSLGRCWCVCWCVCWCAGGVDGWRRWRVYKNQEIIFFNDLLAQDAKARFGTRRTTSYHRAWMEGVRRADNQAGAVLMGFGEPRNNPGSPRNPPRTEHPGPGPRNTPEQRVPGPTRCGSRPSSPHRA